MMDKSGKYWGCTKSLFKQNNVDVHYLEVNGNTYCSEHKHAHKYNKFIVLDGSILIESWKSGDKKLPDVVLLNENDECTISPGIFHKFKNISDKTCKLLEIYWVELNSTDIVRRSIGGSSSGG